MGKSAIDANVNTSIFRKDNKNILAVRRDLAQLGPVRLKLDASTDYNPGQVLLRNISTGLFEKFSAGNSGTYNASCILFEQVTVADQPTTGGALARAVFSGYVDKAQLIDYDTNAKSNLSAREYVDASGMTIVKF